MAAALRTAKSQAAKEAVIERPDGLRVDASVDINALKDLNGRVRGAINCFQNITERKNADSSATCW